mmetsp:Transcript_100480/g.312622  ORF Transcript_100480/g.312622 Transcript_100480/m.312622 type:complete len:163 (-) Transcript_100480:477-965(-)
MEWCPALSALLAASGLAKVMKPNFLGVPRSSFATKTSVTSPKKLNPSFKISGVSFGSKPWKKIFLDSSGSIGGTVGAAGGAIMGVPASAAVGNGAAVNDPITGAAGTVGGAAGEAMVTESGGMAVIAGEATGPPTTARFMTSPPELGAVATVGTVIGAAGII